ncbi:LysR family transcriptional regulator [Lichenibacterium dinghuense]|uniref:LysR family transcriptional regulator n=1 Tax=Lichenibacterium dinghuense TaxID=2895977 RepID=UPI001F19D752|nr:LysR substrate-binding domain-containing protein [Lichenibacterium sp. 6Y81]
MDLRQLRYFVAIVQCGSISRASLQLNIAQPALSLHIRNMEADLGLPLLFRTPQGVQPTEAGLILLRNARLIIEQFEVAQREIRGSAAEPSGEVRLGLPSSISPLLGVPLVLAARARFPKVTLRIAEAMSGYVLDWLRQGRVDLGLLYGLPEDRELRATGLLVETLVVYGAPEPPDGRSHPEGDALSFADLAALPLILPSPGHGLRDLLDAAATARGIRLATAIDIDAYGAIKQLVERRLGYSILPGHAGRREVEDGRLRAWAVDPPLTRMVSLVQPTDRPPTQAVKAVEGLCRATLRDLVRSGEWHMARMRTSE